MDGDASSEDICRSSASGQRYGTHGAIKAITEFSLYLNNLPTFHSITVRESFTTQIEAVNTPSLFFTLFLPWRKHQVKLEDDVGSPALNRLNSASNMKGLAHLQYLCWQITLLQLFRRPWEFPILLSWEWMFMKWKCGALWRSPWCKCRNKLFSEGLHSGKMIHSNFISTGRVAISLFTYCHQQHSIRYLYNHLCSHAKLLQSCPALCDPMDCSQPGSSVHRILQARIREWVAISSSTGSSQPKDWTCVSWGSCIAGRFFDHPGKYYRWLILYLR